MFSPPIPGLRLQHAEQLREHRVRVRRHQRARVVLLLDARAEIDNAQRRVARHARNRVLGHLMNWATGVRSQCGDRKNRA